MHMCEWQTHILGIHKMQMYINIISDSGLSYHSFHDTQRAKHSMQ